MAAIQKGCALLLCVLMVVLAGGAAAEDALHLDARFLLLVNADHPLDEEYEPENLTKLVSRRNDHEGRNENGGVYTVSAAASIQLVEEAAAALTEMLGDADDVGLEVYVRQGYRSFDEETRRYQRLKDQSGAQQPGQNDYQTGLAVTLVNRDWRAKTLDETFGQTKEYQWLAANCARYGFVLRYPEGKADETGWAWEPWHFRYVGREAAEIICLNNLCLEEFIEGIGMLADDPLPSADDTAAPDQPEDPAQQQDPEQEPSATVAPDTSAAGDDTALPLPFVTPVVLPDGPLILDEVGPDGDNEIVLFHD